jgi:hypothetical protein
MRRDFASFVSSKKQDLEMVMERATLVKIIRDPPSGEVHLPKEQVAILAVIQNLNRTLRKVRWEAGGDCMIFPDDVDEHHGRLADSPPCESSFHVTRGTTRQAA